MRGEHLKNWMSMTLKDKIRSQNHFKNKTVFLGQREVPEKAHMTF